MADLQRQPRLLRFDNFEVDLRSGELRKGGAKLKFGGQPFQVLSILLEHPGEVVTREQLQKRLWPDTFVDVDHNLNTAINKIREALGDSAENPRFVETLPRRGYRFIGELEPLEEPDPEPAAEPIVAAVPDQGPGTRRMWLAVTGGGLVLLVLAVAGVVANRWLREPRPLEQASLTAVPFTALPGRAIFPAFSPDGSRIAFAWNGDPKGGTPGYDLYVKAIGSETLLRLTQHPSEWISPAWSPDGTQVAFHRMAGTDTGIYVVPALGGPERKLRSTRVTSLWPSTIAWSPDGKWIAFVDGVPESDQERMQLLSTETLDARQIPIGSKCDSEGGPAFSHNGESLAYWCFRRAETGSSLYSLPVSGGQPRLIAPLRAFPNGLAWSADDKRLVYSLYPFSNETSAEIFDLNVADGSTRQLAFAGSASQPTVSSRGDRLAYSSVSYEVNIWRRDLLHPESPPIELVPSSRAQFDAQYSPDGKRIAFASLRSGVQSVWISDEDGSNLVQISNTSQPSGSPQWSPDGNRIAFDALVGDRWEIFVAGMADRAPRKLITNISNLIKPHWSRDGKWIYFRSNEPGWTGVYRCPAVGGDATALAKDNEGGSPQESFDGKSIYFASHTEKSTLKEVALPGQPAAESGVNDLLRLSNYSLWTVSAGGIYFVPADMRRSVRYFDFATRRTRTIFEADKDFTRGLSLSSDGRWLLYSQIGDVNGDIMLVDRFR